MGKNIVAYLMTENSGLHLHKKDFNRTSYRKETSNGPSRGCLNREKEKIISHFLNAHKGTDGVWSAIILKI